MVINARVLPDVRFTFVDICFVIVIQYAPIHVVFTENKYKVERIQLAGYM